MGMMEPMGKNGSRVGKPTQIVEKAGREEAQPSRPSRKMMGAVVDEAEVVAPCYGGQGKDERYPLYRRHCTAAPSNGGYDCADGADNQPNVQPMESVFMTGQESPVHARYRL